MEHQEEVLDIEIASVSGTSETQSDSLSVVETSQPSGSQDQEPFQNPWPHLERYFKLSRQDKDNQKVLYFECQKCRPTKKIVRGHVTSLNNLKSHIKRTHRSVAIQFEEEIKAGSSRGKRRHHTSGNSSVRSSGSATPELPAKKVRQSTIGEALGSASTGTAVRQSTVDDKIVRLFVNNILPLHVVESEEFVDLLRTLNPTKVSLSRRTLGRCIDDKQRAVEEALINTFDGLTYLATTADCWTAHNSASPLPPPLPPPQKKMKFHADYDSHRYIKAEWFVMFKWLNFNQQANVFTCKNCIWANKINIFSKGKLALKPKKDDFIKHEKLPDHQDAVKAESRPKEMKVATTTRTFFKESKDTMIAAFRTVLCVAQEDVAANKVDAIVKLQLDNVNAPTEMNWNWGASVLRTSEGEPHKGDHYTDHDRVVDIQQCLKRVVDKKLQSDVIKAGYYSIEADEVTDTSNKSIIIVYVRYLSPNSGKPESHFLGVRELYMPSVDGIFHVIKKLLNEKGLDISKMVGMVTDGASVTCDSRTAVVTNFKMIAPFLIGNHCMAHRLQLAAKKAANEILEIQKYIGSLGTFAWAIRNSPKVILTLEASKELHPEKVTQIKQVFSTRWLSFCDSTQAVAGCIPSIIIALHAATEDHSDAIRKTLLIGLTKDIATYKFAMLTHFLADAICFLGILRKSMLMENPTFQQLKKRIDTCVTALQSLRHMDGPYMKQLKGVFPALPPDSGLTEWGTHSIKDTVKERAKFQTARDLFLGEILTRLETTFPDKDIMSAFDVFSPMAVAGEEANGKFDRLVELYGKGKFLNWKNHDRLIDPEATRLEWTSLQGDVSKFGSTQEFYLRFLKTNANDYPNVTRLVAVGLTVPITSVNCERGILKYNAIKTDDMNSLRVENVDRLLTLNSETSRFQDFDYETAFIEWCSMKDRRAFDFTMRKYETPAAHSVAAQDFEDPEVDAIDENPVLDLNKNSE